MIVIILHRHMSLFRQVDRGRMSEMMKHSMFCVCWICGTFCSNCLAKGPWKQIPRSNPLMACSFWWRKYDSVSMSLLFVCVCFKPNVGWTYTSAVCIILFIKKKLKKKIDLLTLLIFVMRGQTNNFFFGLMHNNRKPAQCINLTLPQENLKLKGVCMWEQNTWFMFKV